mmetsp:Transcript_77165/g.226341  ORF Transcript_77165/g.226341 Transcript_77165/m.226341 type:complete len:295 (-) Transcript_77165:207-1091(-)
MSMDRIEQALLQPAHAASVPTSPEGASVSLTRPRMGPSSPPRKKAAAALCRCNSSLSTPRRSICILLSCCRDLEQSCMAPRIVRAAWRLRAMSSCLIFSMTLASLTLRSRGSPTSLRFSCESGSALNFFLNSPRCCSHWPSASISRILRSTPSSPSGARAQRGRRPRTGREASSRRTHLPHCLSVSLSSSTLAADWARRPPFPRCRRLGCGSSPAAALEALLSGSSASSSSCPVFIVALQRMDSSRASAAISTFRARPLVGLGREELLFGLPACSLPISAGTSRNGSRAPMAMW